MRAFYLLYNRIAFILDSAVLLWVGVWVHILLRIQYVQHLYKHIHVYLGHSSGAPDLTPSLLYITAGVACGAGDVHSSGVPDLTPSLFY